MEHQSLKNMERLMKNAQMLLEKGNLQMTMDFCDSVMKHIVKSNLSEPSFMDRIARAEPARKQLLASEAVMTLGIALSKEALEMQQAGEPGLALAILKTWKAADSCFWTAAEFQIEAGDAIGLIKTIIHIGNFRIEREIIDEETRDLLLKNDSIISQLEQADKIERKDIEQLKMMNKQIKEEFMRKYQI